MSEAHIERTFRAEDDLFAIATYIAVDNLDAAMRFLDAAEKTFKTLAEPGEGGPPQNANQKNSERFFDEISPRRIYPSEVQNTFQSLDFKPRNGTADKMLGERPSRPVWTVKQLIGFFGV